LLNANFSNISAISYKISFEMGRYQQNTLHEVMNIKTNI